MTHTARKRFGQNFLHDHSIIYNILASLDAHPDEHWVEIGPGQGALTEPLLKLGLRLDVVELDRDLVVLLKDKFRQQNHLQIHSADALKFDFSALAKDNGKLRIIGNLPYNISTLLMFHLLDNASCIEDMHFMLQKEVVDRICAAPGSKKYGRLSVMMQYYCMTEFLFDVFPESFDPTPKVMSAVIRLIPHPKPPVVVKDKALFNKVVTQAFSQRRKKMSNSLASFASQEKLAASPIDLGRRPESLSVEEFVELAKFFGL